MIFLTYQTYHQATDIMLYLKTEVPLRLLSEKTRFSTPTTAIIAKERNIQTKLAGTNKLFDPRNALERESEMCNHLVKLNEIVFVT